MEVLLSFFNIILYRPLFNILVLLYQYLPGQDFGVAVIVLTLLIKILFYPLGTQTIRSQKILTELQPKIQEIQKKYKENRAEQAQATMELYKKEKINPFSGCLPLLIQLPILIALYQVFWRGLRPEAMVYLYSFVPNPGIINTAFLGKVDLAQSATIKLDGTHYLWPNIILIILTGALQFVQTKMVTPKTLRVSSKKEKTPQFSAIFQKQMLYFFPIFTVFILWRLPSALALYWLVTTLFTIIQQFLILKKKN